MTLEIDHITLPEFWNGYLVGGDHSALTEAEIAEIDAYLADIYDDGWRVVDCADDKDFRTFNGVGTDVVTYTLHRDKQP